MIGAPGCAAATGATTSTTCDHPIISPISGFRPRTNSAVAIGSSGVENGRNRSAEADEPRGERPARRVHVRDPARREQHGQRGSRVVLLAAGDHHEDERDEERDPDAAVGPGGVVAQEPQQAREGEQHRRGAEDHELHGHRAQRRAVVAEVLRERELRSSRAAPATRCSARRSRARRARRARSTATTTGRVAACTADRRTVRSRRTRRSSGRGSRSRARCRPRPTSAGRRCG